MCRTAIRLRCCRRSTCEPPPPPGDAPDKVLFHLLPELASDAATALGGFSVVELKSEANGDVDLVDLERHLDEDVAAFMITQPNTLGPFESRIHQTTEMCR